MSLVSSSRRARLAGAGLVIGGVAVALASCEHRARPRQAPVDDAGPAATIEGAPRDAAAPTPVLTSTAGTPRIVLYVVIDQLPDWALDLHLPRLSPDGLLRRAIERGHRLHAEYPYAVTLTAVGHATLSTGVLPAEHGVYTNGVWNQDRKNEISVVDDGEHPMIGRGDAFASPAVLRAETVADTVRASSGGKARVLALSLKDRAAVLLGGKKPDAAVWYDKKLHSFTTSTYYGDLPTWLTRYLAAHPLDALMVPWKIADGDAMGGLGPDDAPGESAMPGFGRVFPHDPSKGKDRWDLLRDTPQLDEYLIDLAGAAAEADDLGSDDVPDLLALSVSTTDYVGHMFGAESWEYADDLRRVDLALGRLVDRLAAKGPIAVVISSDHGGAPLIESPRAAEIMGLVPGDTRGRISCDRLTEELEKALDRKRGKGEWIAKVVEPYVYLGVDGEAHRDEVTAQVLALLAAHAGVGMAVDVATARTWGNEADPQKRMVAMSVPIGIAADVLVVLRRGWTFDPDEPGGAGSGHGTLWPYDRQVPVIVAGAGVVDVVQAPTVDARQAATTVAALLGVPAAQSPGKLRPLIGK